MTINLFPKKEEKRAPKNKPKISRESKGSAVESSKSAALQVRSMVRVSWTVGFKLSGRRDCDEVAADPGPSIIHALGGATGKEGKGVLGKGVSSTHNAQNKHNGDWG